MAAQSDYRYQLQVNGESEFEVVSFHLTEHLSQPFRLELELASFDSSPDFAAIMDHPATLSFWTLDQRMASTLSGSSQTLSSTNSGKEKPLRFVNGIVTSFVQGETGFERTRYKMVIEPSLVRAGLQSDCRIFQQQDSEAIIRQVLEKNDIGNSKFHLTDSYWVREYCVQYRETDLAFIERLLAEEGTYYYFEHSEDNHILHFSNNTQVAESLGEVLYNAMPSGDRPEAALRSWGYEEKVLTSQQTLRDYTFRNPAYSQEHSLTNHHQRLLSNDNQSSQTPTENIYEKYDYPGRYKADAQGNPFTRYRMEYERRESEVVTSSGDVQQLLPGYQFALTGHQRKSFNTDWLLVGVDHYGSQPGVLGEEAGESGNIYENTLKVIPRTKQWRPTPQPKPLVDGPQIAHIVGPSGEEIYCDDWGRVKVQFPWDREGNKDEHSSCWIRVSQSWAGAKFGNVAIPRIGHEVIVDFLEGDPDQPIVTGRTYHVTTEPAYDLPANKTRMSIKSKTHKGDGFNELRFEDEKDQEEVFIHAEKDQNNVVKNNETTKVGVDRTENVGKDEVITIGNDRTENVGHDESITIANDRTETVGNNENITIGNDQQNLITQNRITKVGKDERIVVDNHRTLDVYANQIINTGGHYDHKVSGKTQWESGELFKQVCKQFDAVGYEEVRIASKSGTVIINASGITLKGKVTIKGSLNITGGAPDGVVSIDGNPNKGIMGEKFRLIDSLGNILLSSGVFYKAKGAGQEHVGKMLHDGETPEITSEKEEPVDFEVTWITAKPKKR